MRLIVIRGAGSEIPSGKGIPGTYISGCVMLLRPSPESRSDAPMMTARRINAAAVYLCFEDASVMRGKSWAKVVPYRDPPGGLLQTSVSPASLGVPQRFEPVHFDLSTSKS